MKSVVASAALSAPVKDLDLNLDIGTGCAHRGGVRCSLLRYFHQFASLKIITDSYLN